MNQRSRPLSPHIQIYRRQITSVLSILHRLTGIVLAAGAVLIAVWLGSIAYDSELFAAIHGFLSSIPGRVFLFLWTLATFYHLCNGIRHLFWDAGRGFELVQVRRSGWAVVIATVVLTVSVWTVGYVAC